MKYFFLIVCCFPIWKQVGAQQNLLKPSAEAMLIASSSGTEDRAYWSELLYKIASPVILNLGNGTLKKNMPLEKAPRYALKAEQVSYLEAVGRTMAGIAPWLALPDDNSLEGQQRKELRLALQKGIRNAMDPAHPDYLDFGKEYQPLVDAAFMAQGFLRAPDALWMPLDSLTKRRVIDTFKSLRDRSAFYNNWLLFAAITESFLMCVDEKADPVRIDIAVKKMSEWYVGDGWYADGTNFAMDYYNSFVIHPMLIDLYRVLLQFKKVSQANHDLIIKRAQRYAVFQERMIGLDGSFPPIGRSITYRTGAFQGLAQAALLGFYPDGMPAGQVRSALTAMHRKVFGVHNNFDNSGWLVLGFCGHQPEVADYYTSTGSLYMTTLSFLPLGLPANDPFWTDASQDWTAKKAWSSQPFTKDYKVNY
ncbi:DUF2264 domain-containing protein [Sphingobacterium lumbrici]|uniref:DUF2264 domain-containing protein n=1 Tax=Sphingobacterium lumbrici TaxID=2559600 RepID=UPI001C107E06|nr:DUF2264 domain-containing protein [Sphingobacterium lumbrici]